MPGPGPRGPRQTYRAPCSSIPDSRISARNPRKTGKSRRARGTRTRQPGTRSTRDGLLCGEIASAAGGTRARAARSAPAAERNPSHGPRSSSSSTSSSPAIDHQLDERRPFVCQIGMQTPRSAPLEAQQPGDRPRIFSSFFVVFARNRQKTAETGHRIWSEFSAKNRELAEIRQFCQNFFRIEDRTASAAERNPAHGSPAFTFCLSWWCENSSKSHTGPRKSRRGPGLSGQLDGPRSSDPRPRSAGPTRAQPVARAMFLTNNPVKNDIDVSRETLPIF